MADIIRCKSCGEWTDSTFVHCPSCDYKLHTERVTREETRIKQSELSGQAWEIPLIRIKPHYPWYVKPFLYTARAIQVTGLAIGGAIAWSAWWAAA